MNFNEAFDLILKKYHLSAKEISELSGISTSAISRYRQGSRKPDSDSAQRILSAVFRLIPNDTLTDEEKSFIQQSLTVQNSVFMTDHFNLLVDKLNITMTELARQVNYSTAYLSSIRLGKRQPADKERFLNGLCTFLNMYRKRENDRKIIAILTGCTDDEELHPALERWLWNANIEKRNSMHQFLNHLDDFDLNQYMTMFHFETPAIPEKIDVSQLCGDYVGTVQMGQAELNFFRMTLISDSAEPIFMHNEMSLLDMAQDMEFNKNWMLSIAMCLKKGLHLNIIHDIDRPSEEMLLGLQAWIPLYMTGQISPYYLKSPRKSLYRNALYVSGSANLTGNCITHDDAWYTLTDNPALVSISAKRAENALFSAHPLMKIFKKETSEGFNAFNQLDSQSEGQRIELNPTLPFYTLSEELLSAMLKRYSVPEENITMILQSLTEERQRMEMLLQHSDVISIIPELSEEAFIKNTPSLSLIDCFCDSNFPYTYAEYQEHLLLTKALAEKHDNYKLVSHPEAVFRNIRITIRLHQWATISKSNPPCDPLCDSSP